MKKLTIVALALASVANFSVIPTAFANSADAEKVLSASIVANPADGSALFTAAIENAGVDSTEAESLLVAALLAVKFDEKSITNILDAAVKAGMKSDTVTALAIASGVDASIASVATASGASSNNANSNGLQANSGNANSNAGAGNNDAGGGGNGGGGGGVSGNL